jgi:hypothetical protein
VIESLVSQPDCAVREAEYFRLLGYPPGFETGPRARELADWARRWYSEKGRPWVYLREASLEFGDGSLLLDGMEFKSQKLLAHLRDSGCRRAVLVAASAGAGCEGAAKVLWDDAKPDEYFFLEIFGSAVVEHLVATISGRICELAEGDGLWAVPHYSPGYAGWDVSEQTMLHRLILQGSTIALPETLEVLSSGMLRPKKSLLAVVGLTEKATALPPGHQAPCHHCSFSPCRYRRSPYRHAPGKQDGRPQQAATPSYTVNPRALKKWAGERLQLSSRPDERVEAVFRFDGTTCSNLGQPLAFEYVVLVGPAADGHPILEASCRPAPGHDGYEKMCAYITDHEGLMGAIAAETPLLGRPLGDVLAWQRTPAPAGCLCTAESRAHNWGLALEVVHFALAQGGPDTERSSPPPPKQPTPR